MAEKKTAAEKAQEALDAAERKYERAGKRALKAEAEYNAANAALTEAAAERDYAAKHPALPGGDAQPAILGVTTGGDGEAVARELEFARREQAAPIEANESDIAADAVEAQGISGGFKAEVEPEVAEGHVKGQDPFDSFAKPA